jgi:hypothetical protein
MAFSALQTRSFTVNYTPSGVLSALHECPRARVGGGRGATCTHHSSQNNDSGEPLTPTQRGACWAQAPSDDLKEQATGGQFTHRGTTHRAFRLTSLYVWDFRAAASAQ